jgi:membrane protease subunit HflK
MVVNRPIDPTAGQRLRFDVSGPARLIGMGNARHLILSGQNVDAQEAYRVGMVNKVVPRAKGEAERKLSEAEGYATKRVNEAKGDAERFTAMYAEYLKAPEVTRQRLYLEVIAEVMPQFEKKVILDDKARGLLPLLPLDLGKPAAPTTNGR